MFSGIIDLPWWGYVIHTLVVTHITIAAVTIYLHRCQAHRALDLNPAVSGFFRAWLWLTTGMVTKAWTAIHRKHHARCETVEDPHSPQILGIRKVLWEGAELYRREARIQETMEKYGHGTPDDWLERTVFSRHDQAGIFLLLAINFILFGFIGITIWAVQMAWIPFFAAGVINGNSRVLATVCNMRQELTALWQRSTLTKEQLVRQLEDWCTRAEESGIIALQEFSRRLRCYA